MFAAQSASGIPPWLRDQIGAAREKYRRVRTTRSFDAALASFSRIEQRPFELFVVGEGNFGKSTILNALLGQGLSKVHFLPETRAFLRFVPKDNPSPNALLFCRLTDGVHDWLKARLPGPGLVVEELVDTRRWEVPAPEADALLREEAARCSDRAAQYEPGIVEVEREVAIDDRSSLPQNIRVVDTQGLNQIFPDELDRALAGPAAATVADRFGAWMNENPRGKHLHWQLRRCDAVLWLAHARKSSSAVTLAALQQFRHYGKRTILAVTNIDRVDDGEVGRAAALAVVERTFGRYVDAVVPVNAKMAMEAVLARDLDAVSASGLLTLRDQVQRLVAVDGAAVRSQGAYTSFRLTEQQLRRALLIYHQDLDTVQSRLHGYRSSISTWLAAAEQRLQIAVASAAAEQWEVVNRRIEQIVVGDDGAAAVSKLAVAGPAEAIRSVALRAVSDARSLLEQLCRGFGSTPFTLPGFDAEGRRFEDVLHLRYQFQPPAVVNVHFTLVIALDTRLFERFMLGVEGFFAGVAGFFFRDSTWSARVAAEREQLSIQQRTEVRAKTRPQWEAFTRRLHDELTAAIRSLGSGALAKLDTLEASLASWEKRPLEQTSAILSATLAQPGMPSPFPGLIMRASRSIGVPHWVSGGRAR
jgi:hypothetical protein